MVAGAHQSQAQLTNSVYGFYYTAWPNVGGFATNVNGFANVGDLHWNKAAADQIIACNSKLIINCTPVFYMYGTPGLNPSYQSAWNNLKTQLTLHYLSQIAAFYVMDEPYYNGFTRAQLKLPWRQSRPTFRIFRYRLLSRIPVFPTSPIPVGYPPVWIGSAPTSMGISTPSQH